MTKFKILRALLAGIFGAIAYPILSASNLSWQSQVVFGALISVGFLTSIDMALVNLFRWSTRQF
jgi:hypothetical protein